MKKTNNKKGFTLAELLVVVAIIAVLVAIAIPIFTSQLEKAREATDAANLRAAYAEVVTSEMTNGEAITKDVTLTQQTKGWQDSSITKIGDTKIDDETTLKNVDKNQTITVGYNSTTKKATFTLKTGTNSEE